MTFQNERKFRGATFHTTFQKCKHFIHGRKYLKIQSNHILNIAKNQFQDMVRLIGHRECQFMRIYSIFHWTTSFQYYLTLKRSQKVALFIIFFIFQKHALEEPLQLLKVILFFPSHLVVIKNGKLYPQKSITLYCNKNNFDTMSEHSIE